MLAGDCYALGQKPQIKAASPGTLLDELVNYLISNTYTKLPYLKARQADPIAEIKAVLAADDIGQQGLGLNGEKATPSPSRSCASTCTSRPAPSGCCCPTSSIASPASPGAGSRNGKLSCWSPACSWPARSS
jgi:hypothetical protein